MEKSKLYIGGDSYTTVYMGNNHFLIAKAPNSVPSQNAEEPNTESNQEE